MVPPFDPAFPLLGIYPKEPQKANLKEHKHPCVHFSIIYISQPNEAAQVSISRWVDKITMEHLHNGTLLSRKEETFTLCNSVCGPEEHYAKWIDGEQDDI